MNDKLLICLKCSEHTWHTNNYCNNCAYKEIVKQKPDPSTLKSEWGGTIQSIIDGERKNVADHLNELERNKCDE